MGKLAFGACCLLVFVTVEVVDDWEGKKGCM